MLWRNWEQRRPDNVSGIDKRHGAA